MVDPREHRLVGTMQYRETLPLADHEVVLTFDDGPLPRNSNQVLEILASQCVKATFFEIGRMAQAYPEGVRKLRDAGHTIGTHTQNHPLSMNRMSIERARQEIDDGIASVKAALGDDADTALAPFFRIPGLLRADDVEDYLATQGIQIWSADFPADDWRHIPASRVYDLAMSRLEAKGKGILLLHDIQARTVAALPRILQDTEGARLSHRPGGAGDRGAAGDPDGAGAMAVAPGRPKTSRSRTGRKSPISFLPTPARFPRPRCRISPGRTPGRSPWPNRSIAQGSPPTAFRCRGRRSGPGYPELPPENAAVTLPAPAKSIFEIPEGLHVALHRVTPPLHRAEQAGSGATGKPVSADTGNSRRVTRGKRRLAHGPERGRRRGRSRVADHATPPAAATHRGALKHLVQVKKRNV